MAKLRGWTFNLVCHVVEGPLPEHGEHEEYEEQQRADVGERGEGPQLR